jgi:NgoFVII restriction endonuclease
MQKNALLTSNLFEEILLEPAKRGARELFVVSGYASASMVTRHFEVAARELSIDLAIDLHIGMSGRDGLSRNTLLGLQSIPRQIGDRTFNCTLSTRGESNHSKVYVWCDDSGPREAFLGSSNYTQLGFGISHSATSHKEICVPIDPFAGFEYVLASAKGGISYKSPNISDFVDLYDDFAQPTNEMLEPQLSAGSFVDLPLVMTRPAENGEVHRKSGLNWGQREGRNPDQAYIPIPSTVAKDNFFPGKGIHFQVVTDDGEAFICTVAQEGDKALETPSDNSILGKYFRKKLGLAPGTFIQKENLARFGSNLVRIYKDTDDYFRLSFQPGRNLNSN